MGIYEVRGWEDAHGMLVWRAKVSMGDFFFLLETLLPSVRAAGEREREREREERAIQWGLGKGSTGMIFLLTQPIAIMPFIPRTILQLLVPTSSRLAFVLLSEE